MISLPRSFDQGLEQLHDLIRTCDELKIPLSPQEDSAFLEFLRPGMGRITIQNFPLYEDDAEWWLYCQDVLAANRSYAGSAASDEVETAVSQFQHIGGTGTPYEPYDFSGGTFLRVNNEIEPKVGDRKYRIGSRQFFRADPRHCRLNPETVRHHTGNNVDLVQRGDGDHHVGIMDTGIRQDGGRGATAMDGHHIELLAEFFQGLPIDVDNDNIMLFHRKEPGDIKADFTSTNHNGSHYFSGVRSTV